MTHHLSISSLLFFANHLHFVIIYIHICFVKYLAYWDKRDNDGYSTDILFLYSKFNAITKNQKFVRERLQGTQQPNLPNFLGLVMAYSIYIYQLLFLLLLPARILYQGLCLQLQFNYHCTAPTYSAIISHTAVSSSPSFHEATPAICWLFIT